MVWVAGVTAVVAGWLMMYLRKNWPQVFASISAAHSESGLPPGRRNSDVRPNGAAGSAFDDGPEAATFTFVIQKTLYWMPSSLAIAPATSSDDPPGYEGAVSKTRAPLSTSVLGTPEGGVIRRTGNVPEGGGASDADDRGHLTGRRHGALNELAALRLKCAQRLRREGQPSAGAGGDSGKIRDDRS